MAFNATLNEEAHTSFPHCGLQSFHRLVGATAEDDNFPSCETHPDYPETWESLQFTLRRWLHAFNKTENAEVALSTAMFLANKATLTVPTWDTSAVKDFKSSDDPGSRPEEHAVR